MNSLVYVGNVGIVDPLRNEVPAVSYLLCCIALDIS